MYIYTSYMKSIRIYVISSYTVQQSFHRSYTSIINVMAHGNGKCTQCTCIIPYSTSLHKYTLDIPSLI